MDALFTYVLLSKCHFEVNSQAVFFVVAFSKKTGSHLANTTHIYEIILRGLV